MAQERPAEEKSFRLKIYILSKIKPNTSKTPSPSADLLPERVEDDDEGTLAVPGNTRTSLLASNGSESRASTEAHFVLRFAEVECCCCEDDADIGAEIVSVLALVRFMKALTRQKRSFMPIENIYPRRRIEEMIWRLSLSCRSSLLSKLQEWSGKISKYTVPVHFLHRWDLALTLKKVSIVGGVAV